MITNRYDARGKVAMLGRDYGFTEIKIHGNDSRGVVKYSSAITQ